MWGRERHETFAFASQCYLLAKNQRLSYQQLPRQAQVHSLSCNCRKCRSWVSLLSRISAIVGSSLSISSIDLTAACRIHLMEPQWNPMAEEQALDRVHRIGQTQPVIATRYIVSESVEEVRIPHTSLIILVLQAFSQLVRRLPAEKEAGSDPKIAWTKCCTENHCPWRETESETSPILALDRSAC